MTRAPGRTVPARRGYEMWARGYDAENAVTTLERIAANHLTPSLTGARLLDAACGIGRRLPDVSPEGPARAIGLDLVLEMLRTGVLHGATASPVLNADITALPLAPASFDLVWCRLALGHVDDVESAYREFHRVLATPGFLIVTDFHPDAARAGHRRTFHDPSGGPRAVAFHSHSIDTHVECARLAGLELDDRRDLRIGLEVRPFYEAAGKLARYEADVGLPLVFGLRFRAPLSRSRSR